MTRIRLTVPDVSATKFAISPLFECVLSYRVLRNPKPLSFLEYWWKHAHSAIGAGGYPLLQALVCNETGYVPDYLVPPPLTRAPDLPTELSGLAATAPDVVTVETARTYSPSTMPPLIRDAIREPVALIERLQREIDHYWSRTTAPFWRELVTVLETDIAHRARQMAQLGTGGMLNHLHESVRFEADHLLIADGLEISGGPGGEGILLLPSVFAWPRVYVSVTPPWRPALTYPCRGVGEMWKTTAPARGGPLGALFGSSRSRMLALLTTPQTTLALSYRLGVTPGAVSLQIRRLTQAGVLNRSRVGRYVFYELNDQGRALLDTLSGESAGKRARRSPRPRDG